MKLKELIKELEKFDGDMDVIMSEQWGTDYRESDMENLFGKYGIFHVGGISRTSFLDWRNENESEEKVLYMEVPE